MAQKNENESDGSRSKRAVTNRGVWTAEEDRKLSEYVEVHGPRRWKNIANKAGLKRCGKSCRLRWLNYLRPNIKRGNISDEEEDLILRLHKLLGNRWSLIAGRLPGRTDNEIKNYWNSHLSKRIRAKEKPQPVERIPELDLTKEAATGDAGDFEINDMLDFSIDDSSGLDWVNKFLELDQIT